MIVMPINIKSKPTAPSAHDAAADALEGQSVSTEVSVTATKDGKVLDNQHESTSEPVQTVPGVTYERIEVGSSFKMPVAEYTMLEFSVRRSKPFPANEGLEDTVFEELKDWVEAKLNSLIEAQQAE